MNRLDPKQAFAEPPKPLKGKGYPRPSHTYRAAKRNAWRNRRKGSKHV